MHIKTYASLEIRDVSHRIKLLKDEFKEIAKKMNLKKSLKGEFKEI